MHLLAVRPSFVRWASPSPCPARTRCPGPPGSRCRCPAASFPATTFWPGCCWRAGRGCRASPPGRWGRGGRSGGPGSRPRRQKRGSRGCVSAPLKMISSYITHLKFTWTSHVRSIKPVLFTSRSRFRRIHGSNQINNTTFNNHQLEPSNCKAWQFIFIEKFQKNLLKMTIQIDGSF